MHMQHSNGGWAGLSMAWIGYGTHSSVVAKELCQPLPASFSNIESSYSLAGRAAVAVLCNFFSCPLFLGAVDTGGSHTDLERVEERMWAYFIPYYFPFSSKFVSGGTWHLFFRGLCSNTLKAAIIVKGFALIDILVTILYHAQQTCSMV